MNWIILSFISAFFSALAAITQKKVLRVNDSLRFTAIISLINLLLLIPVFSFYGVSQLSLATLSVITFKSILSGLAFLMVMKGIKRGEISQVLPFLVLTPGIVALLAYFFLSEALSARDIGGILLLIVGTFLVQYPVASLSSFRLIKNRRGIFFILIALSLFSITAILDKVVLKHFRVLPMDYWFYQHLVLFIFFSLVTIVARKNLGMIRKSFIRSWKLIFLISLFTLIYRYTFIVSVKEAPVALALSLKRISVLFVAIFGGLYFGERGLIRRVVATIILLIGASLIVIN